jgi:hypothetical protein
MQTFNYKQLISTDFSRSPEFPAFRSAGFRVDGEQDSHKPFTDLLLQNGDHAQ